MAQDCFPKLTLDRPVPYQIQVPGHLDPSWADWMGDLCMEVGFDGDGNSISTLTGKFDQAALIGLLRRLYSIGLPIFSVKYLE